MVKVEISDYAEVILLFAVLSGIVLWAARSVGFFRLPTTKGVSQPIIRYDHILWAFSIYLGSAFLIGPSLARAGSTLAKQFFDADTLSLPSFTLLFSTYVQVITLLISVFFLFLFCLLQKDRKSMLLIWKNRSMPETSSIGRDFAIGILTWLVSFPLVFLTGQLLDLFIYFFFHAETYEQVAVRYLKMSLGSSSFLLPALFTIVLAAPTIEEFLFRGILQNFFKRHLDRKAAILLTALSFALFHFSASQHAGNLPLVGSLFALACFLGFIYEKQGSLFASIGLHMTFNLVSVIRIALSPDT